MTETTFKDRFIKREYLPAGELAKRFNVDNHRQHPEDQADSVEALLGAVGWIDEVSLSTNGDGSPSLADNPDAVLFDGHLRVKLALEKYGPDEPVPCNWYQLSPDETHTALTTFDLITEMARPDMDKMAANLERARGLWQDRPDMRAMLERAREAAGVVNLSHPNGNEWNSAFGGLPEGEKSPFMQMTFTLHEEQVGQIEGALKAAKGQGPFDSQNENSNGNALARICETYLTDYGQS